MKPIYLLVDFTCICKSYDQAAHTCFRPCYGQYFHNMFGLNIFYFKKVKIGLGKAKMRQMPSPNNVQNRSIYNIRNM